MPTFGERLKLLRNKSNLSVEKLAQDLGIRKTTLENFEAGYVEPDKDMLQKFASFFNVTTQYIMGEVVSPTVSEYEKLKEICVLDNLQSIRNALSRANIVKTFHLPSKDCRDMELVGVYIHDNSMIQEQIGKNDIIIYQKQNIVNNGDIVVARIPQNGFVVRRYCKSGKVVSLATACKEGLFRDYTFPLDTSDFEIIGKVLYVIHAL